MRQHGHRPGGCEDRHQQPERIWRRLQRHDPGRSRRRQYRYHPRPAAPDRVHARSQHLGRDPEQQRADRHQRAVHSPVLHRHQRRAGQRRRHSGVRRLPRRAETGHLVLVRPGQQAVRQRDLGHPGRPDQCPLQLRPRQAELPDRQQVLPGPGCERRQRHRLRRHPAARDGPWPGLPDLHQRPDRRAVRRLSVGLGPLPAR